MGSWLSDYLGEWMCVWLRHCQRWCLRLCSEGGCVHVILCHFDQNVVLEMVCEDDISMFETMGVGSLIVDVG